jgi:hypothetical protein
MKQEVEGEKVELFFSFFLCFNVWAFQNYRRARGRKNTDGERRLIALPVSNRIDVERFALGDKAFSKLGLVFPALNSEEP